MPYLASTVYFRRDDLRRQTDDVAVVLVEVGQALEDDGLVPFALLRREGPVSVDCVVEQKVHPAELDLLSLEAATQADPEAFRVAGVAKQPDVGRPWRRRSRRAWRGRQLRQRICGWLLRRLFRGLVDCRCRWWCSALALFAAARSLGGSHGALGRSQ